MLSHKQNKIFRSDIFFRKVQTGTTAVSLGSLVAVLVGCSAGGSRKRSYFSLSEGVTPRKTLFTYLLKT